jgi:hypothetical protein
MAKIENSEIRPDRYAQAVLDWRYHRKVLEGTGEANTTAFFNAT